MKTARHQSIVQLIRQHETLTTEDLAALLQVSKETIRRDLNTLQTQGKIIRQHGRAKSIKRETQDSGDPFNTRLKSHFTSKADIARQALPWIDSGMLIALDASSTCWYLAKQLPDIDITVFTNSVRICQELAKRQHIQLISSGGLLQRKYACYVNPAMLSQLKELEIDLFIFSCEGIDQAGVLWDSNSYNAEFKSLLLKRALQSLLLIDKSKMNRTSEVKIGRVEEVVQVISNPHE
ncbi:transcriptional regulator [Chania multitudinisentens RB-25]|uniref:Transcriptional regulator n=1 Tax=Chania multitudinisentens RB-25 TaxID=1441930 RepID=W0LGJ0_9GAMM|nr:L-fucose operon activator [Chania multitudinisentens]AHG21504.1 transcriptional regulator [Chania multitudinisentens RB-25]